MKRHVVEIGTANLLCLAAFFSYAARVPISLPLIGTESGVASSPDAWRADLNEIPTLYIKWPQFPNFCVGLCTKEEYLR
ncbi:MAG: hypothetical protein RB191_19065 [Terriglobia bacterium]|nr:hypothetical protein [Terriglobia bacterium]